MTTTTTKLSSVLTALVAVSLAGACQTLDAPDQNATTLQELTVGTPNRAAVAAAAQGLIAGLRAAGPCTGTCAYIGREGMNLDPSNPQNVPTTFVNGGDFAAWSSTYANNKLADIVIKAMDVVVGMTDAEKSAVKGFAKTVKAIDLMYTILTTDQTGAVLDAPASPSDPIPAVATRAAVYTQIITWLDAGLADLNAAGGASFPFTFTAGLKGDASFTGTSSSGSFNTPANFRQVNRAIRARVNVYRGGAADFTAALTDLAASFLNAAPTTLAQLQTGVYNTYSTTSGDASNGVYDATDRQRFSNNSNAVDAILKIPGDTTSRDNRFTRKIRPVSPAAFARYGFNIFWAYKVYTALGDPIPIIRNEELILLRAEARLACTGKAPAPACSANAADRAAALADINTIRTVSGGLTALANEAAINSPALTGDRLLDELIYNKRFSLLWEGGYRWYDGRHYGILSKFPKDIAGHVIFQYARLPDNECNARVAIDAVLYKIDNTPGGTGGPCKLAAGQ